MLTVAALFVQTNGCYFGLPDVDPWDETRDARLYAGPHPVVCHPPCERWGRYWFGGPSAKERRVLGDDGGCFAAALGAVRAYGGVLEHPEGSHAWRRHKLIAPLRGGGWSVADDRGGWTCCVDQGDYGHRARKATWLYALGCELPCLVWHHKTGRTYVRLDDVYHSVAERKAATRRGVVERLGKHERAATPAPFRDLLLSIAKSSRATDTPPVLASATTPGGAETPTHRS